ncbi:MAG: prolyl oligopeptidase family serine peptidase, partial [Polyangiaceae bacterium]
GVTEYGDPDDARERPALARLSAIEAIHHGQRYPAFFITTATHDERVDPAHPFALASALESASPANEVYVRVDWAGGHLGGGDEPFEKKMAEALAWLVERANTRK